MSHKRYKAKYNKLWESACLLPRQEAIKKLKELAELKRKYYSKTKQ